MNPDALISKLPYYKCAECKTVKEGSPYGIIKMYGNITAPSSLSQYFYGLCKDCYLEKKEEYGNPIRMDCS